MADKTPASGKSLPEPGASSVPVSDRREQVYYECGAGRKTFFCFTFILLLPFYVSLPVMLFQRISKGLWLDTWQLIALGVLFSIVMVLIVFEMIFSLRAEVEVGEKSLSFTLPSGGGVLPWLAYETRDIPYEDIDFVETRREIFGGRYAPMIMRTVRIILKTGETIVFGRTNEKDDDPKFPFPIIAEQIAQRIGKEVVDRGNIMLAFHRRVLGLPNKNQLGSEPEIAELNNQHNSFLVVLSIILALLLVLGIIGDFLQETLDHGERGSRGLAMHQPARMFPHNIDVKV